MATQDVLFNGGDLRMSLEAQGQGIGKEVEAAPEDHVLKADVEAWADALAVRYSVEPPQVLADDVYMDPAEPVRVDVSWDHFSRFISDPSRPAYVPGHRVVVHLPFTGERDVFHLRPSSWTTVLPRAAVAQSELQLVIEYPDDRPASIDGEVAGLMRELGTYLTAARNDIESYNRSLLNIATNAITARQQRIQQHNAHLQQSSIPVGPPRDRSKTYIADVIVRRPAPVLPQMSSGAPMELEPVLQTEIYEHILTVIRQQSLSMETNPKTYATLGEEARRQIILDALNTHYAGAGTAEGFNFGGKTDILIRSSGRSLFIGECKFWSGAKGFTETLDQLFGYQAWRDTKLAVLMFVRERNLSAIVERGRDALAEHPQFVEWGDAESETELRATVRWRGDDRRRADLNVFFISTPTV
jgi:hypothetical protein